MSEEDAAKAVKRHEDDSALLRRIGRELEVEAARRRDEGEAPMDMSGAAKLIGELPVEGI